MNNALRTTLPLFLALAACGESEEEAIERCEKASSDLAETCSGDGNRTCFSAVYASYCATSERPGLYADAIECLLAESSQGSCRSFGDPSGAADCVNDVFSDVDDDDAERLARRYGEIGGFIDRPEEFMPPAYVLSSSQLDAGLNCVDNASDREGAEACFLESVQQPFAACLE